MPYITREDIESNFRSLTELQKVELSARAKAPTISQRQYDRRIQFIFLSHSHKDADLVRKAVYYLLSQNIHVYVDWMDDSMPNRTSAETASKIRQKIDECDQFSVLATNNSRDSKWVPWELGYADGKKTDRNIVIYPVADNNGHWEGAEYFGLYRHISLGRVIAHQNKSSRVMVHPAEKPLGVPFDDYLRSPTIYANGSLLF